MPKNKAKIIIKILTIVGSLFIIFILLVVMLFGLNPFVWHKHDLNLVKFAQEFERIPLPSHTTQLGQLSKEFGVLGNGNHCDYKVSKLVQSDLTKEQLQAYFNAFTLPPVEPEGETEAQSGVRGDNPNSIFVSQEWKESIGSFEGTEEEQEQVKLEIQNNLINNIAQAHKVEPTLIGNNVFVISSADYGYIADDFRCM
jgi:hypothetical protein